MTEARIIKLLEEKVRELEFELNPDDYDHNWIQQQLEVIETVVLPLIKGEEA